MDEVGYGSLGWMDMWGPITEGPNVPLLNSCFCLFLGFILHLRILLYPVGI